MNRKRRRATETPALTDLVGAAAFDRAERGHGLWMTETPRRRDPAFDFDHWLESLDRPARTAPPPPTTRRRIDE